MSATSIPQDAQPSVHGVGSQPRHDAQLSQGSELSENVQDSHWLARKVGELVAEDFRRAHVFSQFGIDFLLWRWKTAGGCL